MGILLLIIFAFTVAIILLAAVKSKPASRPPATLLKYSPGTHDVFTIYGSIEECLASNGIPEQVSDGCITLLKQYMKQPDAVKEIEITESNGIISILIQPAGIAIKIQ